VGRRGGERDPAPVAEVVAKLISRRGWHERLALGTLRSEWALVVGPHIASRSEPVRLEAGRLLVRAEGGAWATELALMAPALAAAAAARVGGNFVREVGVVAGAGATGGRAAQEGDTEGVSRGPKWGFRKGPRTGGRTGLPDRSPKAEKRPPRVRKNGL